ncbi:hypothetical protein OJ998_07405 [Solirubrobacter taibaiensis]|nr:hypothetical protein [Solirubrobacter taibaiensis]
MPTCAICGEEHPLSDMVTGHIEPEDIPEDARRAAPEPRDWWLADGEALHAEKCTTRRTARCGTSRSGSRSSRSARAGEGVWERDGDGYRRVDEHTGDWSQFLADVDELFAAMRAAEG